MTPGDMATLAGHLVSLWAVGFGVGYTITRFREAVNQTV